MNTLTWSRFSVNLAPDTAYVLKTLAASKGITITDAVRRAIAVWSFTEEEIAKGNRIAVVERTLTGERVREVVFRGLPGSRTSDLCMLPDCGCSGERHEI